MDAKYKKEYDWLKAAEKNLSKGTSIDDVIDREIKLRNAMKDISSQGRNEFEHIVDKYKYRFSDYK